MQAKRQTRQTFTHAIKAWIVLLCIITLWYPVQAHANPKYGSIVVDADTGQVLSQDKAGKKLHPASLTKVMTLLLAFEAIESGRADYNTRIRISKHAAGMVPSKLGLKPGSSIKMKDAIRALVTKSANDVAVAMAEHLGGSEYRFARQMNRKAREIGMTDTNFKNASGLHHRAQVTTPRDMAKMARYVIKKYPTYYRFFATKEFSYRGKTYRNHNRLMQTYKGMDGMKTGYINASGFNLIASARHGDRRLIGVVFGGRTSQSRNTHMADLLDRAFKKPHVRGRISGSDIIASASPVPVPPVKPGIVKAMKTINGMAPHLENIKKNMPDYRWVNLGPEANQAIIAQGDTDLDVYKQLNKPQSLIAHDTKTAVNQTTKNNWSVQVGAFSSRDKTDRALKTARKQLPDHLLTARPSVSPLKTKKGWLFRARMIGYTKGEAQDACNLLENCMTIAPSNL